MVWNLFLFKGDFSLWNSQKSQGTKSGLSHLGNLIFCKNLCTRHDYEQMCCCFGAANHQLPIAVALWIIHILSAEECLSLKQNLMQIHCSTCSVILDAMATQYTRSLNGIYCPHWLVKWSHHCSLMHIPVRCPWLPGYIHVTQPSLVVLTMAGLFPDRPLISVESFNFFHGMIWNKFISSISIRKSNIPSLFLSSKYCGRFDG